MDKTIPIRKCFMTGQRLPKSELLRIVKNKKGEIFFDASGKMEGRGIYVIKSLKIIDKVVKNDILSKKLKVKVPFEVYEQLLNQKDGVLDER